MINAKFLLDTLIIKKDKERDLGMCVCVYV